MRVLAILAIVGAFITLSTHAWAGAKPLPLFWGDNHWNYQTFKPYTEDSRMSQTYRRQNDDWTPADWIAQHGSKEATLSALKSANIIKEFDDTNFWGNEKMPVLEVGYAFMQISNRQKRRVAKFVDYAYGVTAHSKQGAMLIEDAKARTQIGVYTKLGLQLN